LSPTGKTGYAAKQQKFKKRHRHASMPVAFLNFELSAYTRILFFLWGEFTGSGEKGTYAKC
jgi:hypothetical protein